MTGMQTSSSDDERLEIELLLPWYATDRLGAADRARVEAYLAAHPDTADRLAHAHDERRQSVLANEAIPAPSSAALGRLLARVAQEPRGAMPLASIWGAVRDLISAPTPVGVRWAAAALGAVIVMQAAVIGTLSLNRPQATYETASGPASTTGALLLVGFADSATAAEINALIAEIGAQIVGGPKPGGLYEVRLGAAASAEPRRSDIVRILRQRSRVVSIVMPGRE